MFIFLPILVAAMVVYVIMQRIRWRLRLDGVDKKFVLITGCDSGFGRQLALRLDTLGVHVLAGCLTSDGVLDLGEKASSRLKAFVLDVEKDESIQAAYDLVVSKLPKDEGLWGLVNNAGIAGGIGFTEWLQRKDYLQVLNINVLGMAAMCRVFQPLLRKAKGRVVNTASILGRIAYPLTAPYSISKYGVEAFSDTLRRECLFQGIKVSIIEPGFFKTPITNLENTFDKLRHAFQQAPNHLQRYYGEGILKLIYGIYQKVEGNACWDTSLVVEAYEHALLAKWPQTRYLVGLADTRILLPFIWSLPTVLGDYLVSKLMPLVPEGEVVH